jgi:hypothetical protein
MKLFALLLGHYKLLKIKWGVVVIWFDDIAFSYGPTAEFGYEWVEGHVHDDA